MKFHLVFKISLLQPYQEDYRPPGPIEVEGEAEYDVKKILQYFDNGRRW